MPPVFLMLHYEAEIINVGVGSDVGIRELAEQTGRRKSCSMYRARSRGLAGPNRLGAGNQCHLRVASDAATESAAGYCKLVRSHLVPSRRMLHSIGLTAISRLCGSPPVASNRGLGKRSSR